MQLTIPRSAKIVFLAAAAAAIAWGLFNVARLQSRRIDSAVSEISDLRDPSPFRVALLGHLDKIALSMAAYLHSPEPGLLAQIDASRHDFENSLPEFERQNKRMFPPAAGAEIRTAYDTMKSSLQEAVDVSAKRSVKQVAITANFKEMLFLIDDRIRPLLRRDSPDLKERLEAIVNVENQLRAWQQNLAQAWDNPGVALKGQSFENDSKGQSLLEDYDQMQLMAAERRSAKSLGALWKMTDDLSRQNFALDAVQAQSLDRLKKDRERLSATLNKLLPAMRPEDLERRKQSILKTIRYRLILAGAIGIAGVLAMAAIIVLIYRQLLPPTEQRWKSTFEIDMKGSVIHWSPAAQALYGYAADEIKGQSVATLFASEAEITQLHHQMQSKEQKQTAFNMMHKAKGGATLHMRVQFLRMLDAEGNLTSIGLACTRR